MIAAGLLLATVILIFFSIGGATSSHCDDGWFYSAKYGNCYIIPANKHVIWNEAEAYCYSLGGHLASIHSPEDFQDVVALSLNYSVIYSTWFGAYRKAENTTAWYNTDGSLFTILSKHWWLVGEPAPEGNCAALKSTDPAGYRVLNCYYEQPFVCKKKAISVTPTPATATSGTVTSPNFPSNYPDSAEQFYFIHAPEGSKVNVVFDKFRSEHNSDYLEMFDSANVDESKLIANLSGTPSQLSYTTTSNSLTMRFVSDDSENYSGFSMKWKSM